MRLLTATEAAEYIGMTYEGLRGCVKRGDLVPDVRATRALLFTTETLDRFKATPRRGRGWQKGRPRKAESALPGAVERA